MEEMQKKLLSRAVSMLSSLKCHFAVIDPDGVKHGDLEVVPPKPPRKKRESTGIDYKPYYYERLQAIVPGDQIHEFTTPDGVPLENLRGAICSHCSRHWGNDTYVTEIKDGKINLMRFA